jgi:hypothetical protein
MTTYGTDDSRTPLEAPAVEDPLVLMCPFCRKEVTAGQGNLRVVTIVNEVGWRGDQSAPRQRFACHRECLDGLLGSYVPIL